MRINSEESVQRVIRTKTVARVVPIAARELGVMERAVN
jgi:hypothetical protein